MPTARLAVWRLPHPSGPPTTIGVAWVPVRATARLRGRPPAYAVSLPDERPGMIEEYARHNGHADLLRERIDGTVGE